MKRILIIILILIASNSKAQDQISWSDDVVLKISDFKSPATQIGNVTIYSLHSSAGFQFAITMSNLQFIFTKNFNDKIQNKFNPEASSLVAPDSTSAKRIVRYAKFEFDLAEVYARKLRKKLIEEKSSFSNVTFFKPFYDEMQKKFVEEDTNIGKETDLGRKEDKLEKHEQEVKLQLTDLSQYCESCKLPKKKK